MKITDISVQVKQSSKDIPYQPLDLKMHQMRFLGSSKMHQRRSINIEVKICLIFFLMFKTYESVLFVQDIHQASL